jgi:hypothetical protein
MLMPVDLPEQLVVADRRAIEMIDPAPVPQRSARAARRIAVPVDRRTERHALVAEQVEHAVDRAIGPAPRTRLRVRTRTPQQ